MHTTLLFSPPARVCVWAWQDAIGALPEEPIQLIEVGDDGSFSVGAQAKAALQALGPGKICVVAVAGLYRTGKSSLVNFLLEQEGGFKVGPTVARCTRGIWMWCVRPCYLILSYLIYLPTYLSVVLVLFWCCSGVVLCAPAKACDATVKKSALAALLLQTTNNLHVCS